MKAKNAGILSALLSSICCIGPLLLVAVGLGAGAAVIGRYHWWFIAAAIGVLALAWTKYFREKAACACEQGAMQGRRSGTITLLIATVIVLGFVGLNTGRLFFARTPGSAQPSAARQRNESRRYPGGGNDVRHVRGRHSLRAQERERGGIGAC